MPVTSPVQSIRGRLEGFNLSPKGAPEGLVVDISGSIVQINFSPELAGAVTTVVKPGDAIELRALPFRDAEHEAHPVFDLVELKTVDGRSLIADGEPEADVKTRGIVKRINFARRGEPNGGILDNGDFVHLRPHGAKQIGLKLGMMIEARGEVRGRWSGHRVIEAESANGRPIEKPKKSKPPHPEKHPPHHRPH